MPRDRYGASNIGTFTCRSFPRDTKASKRANPPTQTLGDLKLMNNGNNMENETSYLEIETICIYDNDVTIAANILLKDLNYSDSIYTNIFCDNEQLTDFLLEEASYISKQIFENKTKKNADGTIQIDLHDINDNKPWRVNSRFILEPVESSDYAFTCYRLKQSIK